MAKEFQSAAMAASFLADDEQVAPQVEQEVLRTRVVTALVKLRITKGLTQKQVAEVIGCDASKISKLEASYDASLKWGDLVSYLNCLGVNATLILEDDNLPASDRIKRAVFRIHELLQELAQLAKEVNDDSEITDKIHQFYGEVLFNFLMKFADSYEKLSSVIEIPGGTDATRLISAAAGNSSEHEEVVC
jgi:transcriptional regulator with XRE-family HTH domain